MVKPKIVPGSDVKGKPKTETEDFAWEFGRGSEAGLINSNFTPRRKGAGDLIRADDWNDIQTEIKDDLCNIVAIVNSLTTKSQFLIASGVSSHEMYIQLNWGVKPHVLVSFSGYMESADDPRMPVRCYPRDITGKGFRIYAQSDDGAEKGIVNWIAFGVLK